MKWFIALMMLPVIGYSQSMYDSNYAKTVVLIESFDGNNYQPKGTGFIVQSSGKIFLVTNQHVLGYDVMYVTCNISNKCVELTQQLHEIELLTKIPAPPVDSCIIDGYVIRKRIVVREHGRALYYTHPRRSLDIAVLPFKINGCMDVQPIGTSLFALKDTVKIGNEVWMVGFPRGIGIYEAGDGQYRVFRNAQEQKMYEDTLKQYRYTKLYPAIRFGVISWKQPYGNYFSNDIVGLDGNSGSPVFGMYPTEDGRYNNFLYGIHYQHSADFFDAKGKDKDVSYYRDWNFSRTHYAQDILDIIYSIK